MHEYKGLLELLTKERITRNKVRMRKEKLVKRGRVGHQLGNNKFADSVGMLSSGVLYGIERVLVVGHFKFLGKKGVKLFHKGRGGNYCK